MCERAAESCVVEETPSSVRQGDAKQHAVPADVTTRRDAPLFVLILAPKQERGSPGIAARALCRVPNALSEYHARISADVQLGFSG
jgi:hypothetical protein